MVFIEKKKKLKKKSNWLGKLLAAMPKENIVKARTGDRTKLKEW